MVIDLKPEMLVSIYAALLSSVLAGIQIWKHLKSGVHLKLTIMQDAIMIGGDRDEDERDLLVLNVTNRGDAPTVLTHMVLHEFPSYWAYLRDRPSRSFIIPNPQTSGYPAILPCDLGPSKKWTGIARRSNDQLINIDNGKHYVGVVATNRDRSYLVQIPQRVPKQNAES